MTEYLVFDADGNFNSHTTDLAYLQSLTLPLGWLFIQAPPVWDQCTTCVGGIFTNNPPPIKPVIPYVPFSSLTTYDSLRERIQELENRLNNLTN